MKRVVSEIERVKVPEANESETKPLAPVFNDAGGSPVEDLYYSRVGAGGFRQHIERSASEALLDEEHVAPSGYNRHHADANVYTWGRFDIYG